ncbi:hypothetical protein OROMI_030021 [Orobanche minor]
MLRITMADESTDSLVPPGTNENGRNTSKSECYQAGDSSNENPTEKSYAANSNQNLVHGYLRASTGSCHDFCKYGKKHLSEEKAKKPLRKRIAKPLLNEHSVQIMVSVEQDKEKVVNHKLPTNTRSRSLELKPSLDSISYFAKTKTSLDEKKVIRNKSFIDTKIHSPAVLSPDKETYLEKPKIPSAAKTDSPKQNASSGNKPVLLDSKSLSAKNCPSPEPPEIVKSVFFPSKINEVQVTQGSSADNRTSKAEKTIYQSNHRSSPVKSKPIKVKPLQSSSSDNSDGKREKGRKNSELRTSQNMTRASTLPAKKVMAASCAATSSTKLPIIKTAHVISSRKAGNLKLVSHQKDGIRMRTVDKTKTKTSKNEKVSEKILHVIGTESKNKVIQPVLSLPSPLLAESQSHENSSFLSFHEEDKLISDSNECLEIIFKVPTGKESNNRTLGKTKVVVVSEDNKNRTPMKLKFRNGEVMDVQSNNNSLRKVRFRRARVTRPEEGKSDPSRRSFKKTTAVNDDKTGEKVTSEKVVLKHQVVLGKKDAEGLLNNVIEQTASKLVASRKSKVKALVGAFETVISLQENSNKPSSRAVS